jgi:hypothetical protein
MAANLEHPSDEIIAAVQYLQAHGLTNQQFADIHHFRLNGHDATYAATLNYFAIHRNLGDNNLRLRDRLVALMHLHQNGAGNFSELLPLVLQQVPL